MSTRRLFAAATVGLTLVSIACGVEKGTQAIGGACGSVVDCESELASCLGGKCCLVGTAPCEADGECCGGACSELGRCCASVGAICEHISECCGGLFCGADKTCQRPGSAGFGETCGAAEDCRAFPQADCEAATCCSSSLGACAASTDCCLGLTSDALISDADAGCCPPLPCGGDGGCCEAPPGGCVCR